LWKIAAMGNSHLMFRHLLSLLLVVSPILARVYQDDTLINKCREDLCFSAGSDNFITRSEWVTFIERQSNYNINADSFDELPGAFRFKWYATTCRIATCFVEKFLLDDLLGISDSSFRSFSDDIQTFVNLILANSSGSSSPPPSLNPSFASRIPSTQPTVSASRPSSRRSFYPTNMPSRFPSNEPSSQPSREPLSYPSKNPIHKPSIFPTSAPNAKPSPSAIPTSDPSSSSSALPSASLRPSSLPSSDPSVLPPIIPSLAPSALPSDSPYGIPSTSGSPSSDTSSSPSALPSLTPSLAPSSRLSDIPSMIPSQSPSLIPTPIQQTIDFTFEVDGNPNTNNQTPINEVLTNVIQGIVSDAIACSDGWSRERKLIRGGQGKYSRPNALHSQNNQMPHRDLSDVDDSCNPFETNVRIDSHIFTPESRPPFYFITAYVTIRHVDGSIISENVIEKVVLVLNAATSAGGMINILFI